MRGLSVDKKNMADKKKCEFSIYSSSLVAILISSVAHLISESAVKKSSSFSPTSVFLKLIPCSYILSLTLFYFDALMFHFQFTSDYFWLLYII